MRYARSCIQFSTVISCSFIINFSSGNDREINLHNADHRILILHFLGEISSSKNYPYLSRRSIYKFVWKRSWMKFSCLPISRTKVKSPLFFFILKRWNVFLDVLILLASWFPCIHTSISTDIKSASCHSINISDKLWSLQIRNETLTNFN